MGNRQAGAVPQPSLSQRVQEMQSTVEKMHVVLKQMRAKTGATTSKDPIVKANLQMWGLMVDQLEKQLQELKLAEANRADMEARRAAMYKQAEIKSQAAAGAAQQPMFSHQPTGSAVATQPAGQNAGAQAPAASQAPTQTPNTASPN
jgi:peptidoglycan hydrolase CwlO-like protein